MGPTYISADTQRKPAPDDMVLPTPPSPGQVRLAREVQQYLTQHLMDHRTIDELCQQFSTSPTRLKDSFRRTYGVSVQTFVRQQRMQAAAQQLLRTDRTIADIAGEFGYSNASKFSAAFQRVMGDPPSRYRRKHLNP